jgi:hypothetical protein
MAADSKRTAILRDASLRDAPQDEDRNALHGSPMSHWCPIGAHRLDRLRSGETALFPRGLPGLVQAQSARSD